jgi:gamma-glutamylcysteine synthetase
MTESQIQVVSASAVQAAPSGLYNFNLNVSGQLQLSGQETDNIQETEDETIQTDQAPGESQSQVVSDSAVQAAPSGLYNFSLNLSGQLQLSGQETDNIQETEDETIQTS